MAKIVLGDGAWAQGRRQRQIVALRLFGQRVVNLLFTLPDFDLLIGRSVAFEARKQLGDKRFVFLLPRKRQFVLDALRRQRKALGGARPALRGGMIAVFGGALAPAE